MSFLRVYIDYMKIDLSDIDFFPLSRLKQNRIAVFPFADAEQGWFSINIHVKTFCPYFEAFKRMNIMPENSVKLCKWVLERPCQVLFEQINPGIHFFRNYECIRPVADYCDERLLVRDYGLVEKLGL